MRRYPVLLPIFLIGRQTSLDDVAAMGIDDSRHVVKANRVAQVAVKWRDFDVNEVGAPDTRLQCDQELVVHLLVWHGNHFELKVDLRAHFVKLRARAR